MLFVSENKGKEDQLKEEMRVNHCKFSERDLVDNLQVYEKLANDFQGWYPKKAVLYMDYPKALYQCCVFASFQCGPQTHDSQVRMIPHCLISFVANPIDENMKCAAHPTGCGKQLEVGDTVIVDATECQLVQGKVYYIAARKINDDGQRSCKIGYVKCLFNQVHLFAHRVGVITSIEWPDPPALPGGRTVYLAKNHCNGTAKLVFTDTGRLGYKQEEVEEE